MFQNLGKSKLFVQYPAGMMQYYKLFINVNEGIKWEQIF